MKLKFHLIEDKYQSQPCEYIKSSTSINMLSTEEQLFSESNINISTNTSLITNISPSAVTSLSNTNEITTTRTTITSTHNNSPLSSISSEESQASENKTKIHETIIQLITSITNDENEEISTVTSTTTTTTTTKKISCKVKSSNKKIAVGEYHLVDCINGTKVFRCNIDGTLSIVNSTCASHNDWYSNLLNIKVRYKSLFLKNLF